MANLTESKVRQTRESLGGVIRRDNIVVPASTSIWAGGFYGVNPANQLVPSYALAGTAVGRRVYLALEDLVNLTLAVSARGCLVQFSGLVLVQITGVVTAANRGAPVYQTDSDLADLTSTTNALLGRLAIVNTGSTMHWVDMDQDD